MHDPYTQIKDFHWFILWHKDPENRGDDDSCGWFPRSYHFDQKLFEKVVKDFEFEFKHNYWFHEDGTARFSTMGIVLQMYKRASWTIHYPKWGAHRRFMKGHLLDILSFAENSFDSLHTAITEEMYYRTVEHDRTKVESRPERIRHLASIVFGDIMRNKRPWYKHPRWHVHHWRLSICWWHIPVIKFFWKITRKKEASNAVDSNLRETV